MALSKEEILKVQDITVREVKVPEWGGSVHIRVITGADRDQFDEALTKASRKDGTVDIAQLRAKLLALAICDSSGKPLFTLTDADAINRKSAKAIMRLFAVAQDMNGFTEESIKELLGNSGGAPSGASGSALPAS